MKLLNQVFEMDMELYFLRLSYKHLRLLMMTKWRQEKHISRKDNF